jgi:hypothetical protein
MQGPAAKICAEGATFSFRKSESVVGFEFMIEPSWKRAEGRRREVALLTVFLPKALNELMKRF